MTPVSISNVQKQEDRGGLKVSLIAQDPAAIADRFLAARRSAAPLESYPGQFPEDLGAAYKIQDEAIAAWGREVIGWKVGRIMPPLSERFGTDRLAGPIFMAREAGGSEATDMPVFDSGFAAGESEFLLRIGKAPPAGKSEFTLEEAMDYIDAVHVGIEIASSPLASINELGPVAVISDFGNNNGLLIGGEVSGWATREFEHWTVKLAIDGRPVAEGRASAFPDGAIGSARFLFELMARRKIALRPGQWISSGAVGGVHDARPGQIVEARFGNLAPVRCRLVAAAPE
jgi:2-keto-4-pentenoate hydratase